MSYKLVHESGISYNVLSLEISATNTFGNGQVMYVTNDRIDSVARTLSQAFPERRVEISAHARNKAVYLNGERTQVLDYHNFYSNLTEEEYEATKILCSETGKWI